MKKYFTGLELCIVALVVISITGWWLYHKAVEHEQKVWALYKENKSSFDQLIVQEANRANAYSYYAKWLEHRYFRISKSEEEELENTRALLAEELLKTKEPLECHPPEELLGPVLSLEAGNPNKVVALSSIGGRNLEAVVVDR